jgi:ABC-type nitrate/sulfonate/bicarbonate transport system substrate-binding protein
MFRCRRRLICRNTRKNAGAAMNCIGPGLTQLPGILSMPPNDFHKTRRQFIGSATTYTMLLASGCRSNSTNTLPRTKIKAGYVKVLAALPFMYAVSNELFAKRNFDVELIEFASSNEVATAAIAGQIDFIGAGATNACLDAITASGKVLQISTTNDYVRRPDLQSTDFLIAQKQFKSIADLKGQTVAFFPGSFGRVFARLVLPKIGLSIDEVNYVEMAPAQWLASLKSGAIQAVTAMEPIATNIMLSMDVSVLVDGYYGLAMQNVPGSGTWFRSGHLHPKVERSLQEAMLESIKLITENPKVASKAIEQLFGLPTNVAEKVRLLSWNDATMQSARENLTNFAALLDREGAIQKPLPGSDEWIWSFS